jgi:multidrug efflux pump subunit AcrA (membrane-fusion protein)
MSTSFPRDATASIPGRDRLRILSWVLGAMGVALAAGWLAGSRIESPADAAARTAPPKPSPILVPVERRVLSSNVVTRGTARFGLPQPISISPSSLKANPGLITTLPLRNASLEEGGVLLSASGRPVFVLQGAIPAFRDLAPGLSGDDVRQLEEALRRLGLDPGALDGRYDQRTAAAVADWYRSSGWEPFAPTPEQVAHVRGLEQEFGEATKARLAADSAAAAAVLAVEAARASAEHDLRVAEAELAARAADRARLLSRSPGGTPLAVESERAKAAYADTAARAEVAATIADRALVVLDPRQTATARAAADAKLELARASALKTELESELAIQAAEREAALADQQLALAEAAVRSAGLAGDLAVQAAIDAQKVAELDARLAAGRADRLGADLALAKSRLGVQVPLDEIVFLPSLPVRVEEVTAAVGSAASGPILSVTDHQLAVDAGLALDSAPLVKPGMPVAIDEPALGIKATGVVHRVADTPGTHGVDGYHIYCEVRVQEAAMPLQGFSVRLTIPIQSTQGEVTVVPLSALSLAADGTSRVQVERNGALEFVAVEPGLSADGFVEVAPVRGTLAPGELVVVGYENPEQV